MVSRIRKREERAFLRRHINKKDRMMNDIILSLSKFASSEQIGRIQQSIFAEWSQYEEIPASMDPEFTPIIEE